jgi:hypothetical protein
MGSETTVEEAAGTLEKIALSLGLPPFVVEISFIILTLIIFLIAVVFLFAVLRIRKEMISLNFKFGYIARLLKREIGSPGPGPETQTPPPPEKEDPFKEEWKF